MSSPLEKLARIVSRRPTVVPMARPTQPMRWTRGVVSAVNDDNTITVQIDGKAVTVPAHTIGAPGTVGDVVDVLVVGNRQISFGVTNSGGSGGEGSPGPKGTTGTPGPPGTPGPAGIVWRTAWSSSTTYQETTAVSYDGSSYYSKTATNHDHLPTTTTHWGLLAAKGTPGPAGAGGTGGAYSGFSWDSTTGTQATWTNTTGTFVFARVGYRSNGSTFLFGVRADVNGDDIYIDSGSRVSGESFGRTLQALVPPGATLTIHYTSPGTALTAATYQVLFT